MRSEDEDVLHFCHCRRRRRNLWHFGRGYCAISRDYSQSSSRAKMDGGGEIEIGCINDGGIIGDASLPLSLPQDRMTKETPPEWDTPRAP